MFSRVVTFTGAKDIDGGVRFVEDEVVPVIRQQKGYRGMAASADRTNGVFSVLSVWETAADRDASESAMAKVREDGGKVIGGTLSVDHFEVVLWEIAGIAGVGSSLLIRFVSMDPGKVDENLAFFKSTVLPEIKAQDGFLGVRQLINRETGEGAVGTLWSTKAAMDAAAAEADSRAERAAKQGVTFRDQSKREVVFVDM